MSLYAKVWAYDQHPLQVDKDGNAKDDTRNPAAKAVLVALAEYPGVGQRECWPSQETISVMTDFDVRTVRKHLDVLEKQGYIARKERHRDGKRTTDMVTLLGPVEAFGPSQLATKKQPERVSGRKQSNRNVMSKQPERVSGEPVVEPSVKKNVSNDTFKESELSSTHRPKTIKVSDEKAEELWESLIAEDENADTLQEFAELTACKLKTKSRTLATLWRQIGKPYLTAKEAYGAVAVAAGLQEAMQRDISDFRYAASVAKNWTPPNSVTQIVPSSSPTFGTSGASTPQEIIEYVFSNTRNPVIKSGEERIRSAMATFDFTGGDSPPYPVQKKLGGDDSESWAVLESIRTLCRRALRDGAA